MVHISDWFPTILNWANYTGNIPVNLDGVDQTGVLSDTQAPSARTKFVYGMINTWDEDKQEWVSQYAVRYGKWKFMNFRREWAQTSECVEG